MCALVNIEKQLINQLKAGDKKAFDKIYALYWKDFYLFALRATNDTDEAEDLVQDLFVDLWIKKDRINISSSIKAYLFTAIKNNLLDKIRREKRFENYTEIILKQTKIDYQLNPEQELVLNEKYQQLLDRINCLPEKCREIFVLNKIENYSIAEIAEKLSISPQTVKNQLTKASKLIKPYKQEMLNASLSILWMLSNH